MSVGAFPVPAAVVKRRRSAELALIVMAAAITGVAYTLASLGANAQIPARMGPFLALLLALIALAHIAVRLLARGADPTLLPVVVLLHGLGFVMITRLDDRLAGLQALWSLIAVVAFVATLLFVQRAGDLARYKWTLFFGGALALMLPMMPLIGNAQNGARIWVKAGPLNFQPGE
ncbi:MAG TPA: FtsW/RodA/SpoVE family cell cycle protein, partial [Ilumatobacter sp.]|nr:FtsW/RodA/SpoVE family cell cycle protein [Ilumatobacter sp.]